MLRRGLRAIGWGAALLLIVVFLVGYAAPYLSPTRFWWVDLIAVLVPLLSGGVGILALWLCIHGARRRQWRRVGLGGILFVFLLVRFGGDILAWRPAFTEASALRIMTFNVPRYLGRAPARTKSLGALVRREEPHVAAFQESQVETASSPENEGAETSSAIRSLLNGRKAYGLPQGYPVSATIQQPVLSRITLDSMSIHRLPPDGRQNARARYTRTAFTWEGRSAVLYNVHLHTVGRERPWLMRPSEWIAPAEWMRFFRIYRRSTLRRAQQARLIRRHIEREERPVIVVGDFNSTPHQWAYRHIAQGLQDAARQRVAGWRATFPAQYPLVQIDHILADPAWQVTAARIPAPRTPPVSDHRPVVAHLQWRGGGEGD